MSATLNMSIAVKIMGGRVKWMESRLLPSSCSQLNIQLTSEEMTKSFGRYWGNFSKNARIIA